MVAKIFEIKIAFDVWMYRWMAGTWTRALTIDDDRVMWRSVNISDIPTEVLQLVPKI